MPKKDVLSAIGVILAMAFIILSPALINGFPFTDIDSMSYLSTGLVLEIPENRPVYYSLFTAALSWGIHPWPVAAAQCIIVALGIWHVARVLFGVSDWRVLLAVAAALTLASALPWYASYMTPDIFTAALIVALMMLGLAWERLSPMSRVLYVLFAAACVSFHYGNVVIAFGANLVFGVLALLGWRPVGAWRPRFLAINGAAGLGVLALFTATTYDHGRLAFSPSGSTFYLARLLDDGPALKVLNSDCPTRQWRLCAELPALNVYAAARAAEPDIVTESMADFFLWRGPLQRLEGFEGVEPEAGEIVRLVWARYPLEQISATIGNGVAQAREFWIGNLFDSWGEREPYPTLVRVFSQSVGDQHLASRQQRGELEFGAVNLAANILLALSLAFVVFASVRAWRGERLLAYASLALLFFLLGNAFTMGPLSGVFARYQARVIWLLPMLAMLWAAKLYLKPVRGARG